MQILPSIPHQLRGRGAKACVPFKCDCGAQFLWEHKRGPIVICPDCRLMESVPEENLDTFNVTHNGQQR